MNTPSMQPAVLTITCAEFATPNGSATGEPVVGSLTVTVGDDFRITLCSNPSTGFSWETPVVTGSADAALVDHQRAPAADSMAGAPGTETFTFRAASAGTATIDFRYSRPWEGGEKGAWKATVTVVAGPGRPRR